DVQQAEETAAEAEPERGGRLRLVGKGRVVETQLLDGVAQLLVLRTVDRIETREHHRLHAHETRERLIARPLRERDRVAYSRLGDVLDPGGEEADFTAAELLDLDRARREHADARDLVRARRLHHADAIALTHASVEEAHHDHRAEVRIEP